MLAFLRRAFSKERRYYRIFHDLLGFTPHNVELYKLALIHRSASYHLPYGGSVNNERLEFLGDAILEGIISDYLFIELNREQEGGLTRMRSRIVSRTSLDTIARKMGLAYYIVTNQIDLNIQKHIPGNALEALIGAMYLDKGYNFTNRYVINNLIRKHLDINEVLSTDTDYKSRLIEHCQKSHMSFHFKTSAIKGAAPGSPQFSSKTVVDGAVISVGTGTSKKEAEQNAAMTAIEILDNDSVGDFILDRLDGIF